MRKLLMLHIMAKLTRSNSQSALAEGQPAYGAGTGQFTIGLTSRETGVPYHLHLTDDEARGSPS